jgi:SNF2 family DNA or RNA helicase
MLERNDLRDYQHHAVEFIKTHKNCALWMDMGLGKSCCALTAFADLLAFFDARRMLVIAPLRVARKVWGDEIKTWAHLKHLTISPIIGTARQRMAALRTPADIHTINRENCRWLEAQFIQNGQQILSWPWDIVVLDESQSFKSQSSQRWKSMRRLRRLIPRVVQLTGTPSPQGYGDLWSQAYLLDQGERLGRTERAFEERWFEFKGYGEWQDMTLKSGADKQIQKALADIVLSLREEDYLDLPVVVKNFVKVQLEPAALKTYRKFAREYISEVKGTKLTAVNSGVLDGKLLQLANGAIYTGEGNEWIEFHQEKLAALQELLDGIPGKVLIAYHYVHDLRRIEKLLGANSRRWSVLRSDDSFTAWAAGEYDIGVLHPASAGHGLNDVYKAGAHDLIHFGLNPSLELYQQINARLTGGHRRMDKHITIHHIIAEETRDEDYVELLKGKEMTQADLKSALRSTR